uniref:Acid phosphatase 1 n=1 Tax=Aegilops tauschii subsp. strangulata TaxID=200361 RepID=A0A453QHP1_AEGTS
MTPWRHSSTRCGRFWAPAGSSGATAACRATAGGWAWRRTTCGTGRWSPPTARDTWATTCSAATTAATPRSSSTRPSPTLTASGSPAMARRCGSSTSTKPCSPIYLTTPRTASGMYVHIIHAICLFLAGVFEQGPALIFPFSKRKKARPYNATSYNAYVLEGSAPALPETKRLYNKLLTVGIKPVFLTGRTEDQRAITVANLRRQGISGWMNLLLKQPGFKGSAVIYKSGERQKLQDAGYVIVGNIGDQWSDILGAPEGARTFKLPDPMYYIG